MSGEWGSNNLGIYGRRRGRLRLCQALSEPPRFTVLQLCFEVMHPH